MAENPIPAGARHAATFRTLLARQLKEMHDAERQLVEFLPEIIETPTDPDLEICLTRRLGQALRRRRHLSVALARLGFRAGDLS